MDERIDVTKRKPRRLRGTPALSFVNRASLIVLGVAVAIGVVTTLPLNLVEKLREKYNFDLVNVSDAERERRTAFSKSFVKPKTTEEILELMKHDAETAEKY